MTKIPDRPRRRLLQGAAAAAALSGRWAAAADRAAGSGARKVLRLLFNSAESSLDPARISDIYSRAITAHIFEALYGYDHLARPSKLVPLTADGMPEVSPDFRVWTIRLQRGIRYPDDPAFKGQVRALQARDYVFAIQRTVDPANISPIEADTADLGIVGLKEARDAAIQGKRPFDYDRPIPGLRALDSHTLRIELHAPRPRLLYALAKSDLLGAQAREVVEFYGKDITEHPVGTGAFRLTVYERQHRFVLERNPKWYGTLHPEMKAPGAVFPSKTDPEDVKAGRIDPSYAGRALPFLDRINFSRERESIPRFNKFLQGYYDDGGIIKESFDAIIKDDQLSPEMAARGTRLDKEVEPTIFYIGFNMDDAVIGTAAGEKSRKLRQAMSLAVNAEEYLRLFLNGRA